MQGEFDQAGSKEVVDRFADNMRVALKDIAAQVNDTKLSLGALPHGSVDPEVFANLTLCYRHLEDASMRLGKVKQFNGDGESPYDQNVVGSKE